MALILPKPAGIKLNGNSLTDHQRSSIDITPFPIEYSQRMWNGRLRKRVIATKHNIRTSWELLPGDDEHTVDGFWGAKSMRAFYTSAGEFVVTVTYADSSTENFTCVFADFSMQLQKRGAYDLYSVSMALEEV